MRLRSFETTILVTSLLVGGTISACKERRANPPSLASKSEGNSDAVPGSFARIKDWFKRDTSGENSGSPILGIVDVTASVPAIKDNPEFGTSSAGTSGSGNFGRPEDSGTPVPTDPFAKVCLGPGGEAFEKMQPLFCVPVPQPSKTDIINKQAAIRLGKALFWDIQVGGDGKTACATCHFVGGADNRTANIIHPGPNDVFESGKVNGPGQTFSPMVDITSDDRAGSPGVVGGIFTGVNASATIAVDNCTPDQVGPFFTHRRVTGRNTPSVIAAVYNKFNFWDGRASPNFNGFDPFGETGNATSKTVLFTNGSLASQAVGPPNNATEMSCSGRRFNGPNSLASKMLARQALQFQVVSPTDSSLGELSAFPAPGLTCYGQPCTYATMIRDAFGAAWVAPAQDNFSRLWGEALQAYMSILIPSQTRYDQFLAGKTSLLNSQQRSGLDIFLGRGECSDCHVGGELTDASVNYATLAKREDQGGDEGFHNLGVTRTEDDLGRANVGPIEVSWSKTGSKFDRGAFKTPSLRNLKLTAPYFHNGGKATIEAVVAFYAHRGGDFANAEMTDEMQEINIESAQDQADLVEFLRNGLTDCRVEKYRAPFDHPQLNIQDYAPLPAVGMTGTGSCRLDPKVPPTTVNCIKNPGICDTNNALFATSLYLDLVGRVPSKAENTAALSPSATTGITNLLKQPFNVAYDLRRSVESLLGLEYVAVTMATFATPRGVAISTQYFAKAGNTNAAFLKRLMLDLGGRQPSAAELSAAGNLIIKTSGRGLVYDYYMTLESPRFRQADGIYRRFLRREATAAERTAYSKVTAANISTFLATTILQSVEYKALAADRDDI